jgi:hypothetical protein
MAFAFSQRAIISSCRTGNRAGLAPMVDDETSAASQGPRQIITFP